MHETILVLVITLSAIAIALVTASRRRRPPASWALRVKALAPSATRGPDGSFTFDADGRPFSIALEDRALSLSTQLPTPPLPYPLAARALGDGVLIAALADPDITCEPPRLTLKPRDGHVSIRSLRRAVEHLSTLAARLESIPLDEALARHLLDHARGPERPQCFKVLMELFPDSQQCLRCAHALEHDDDPEVRHLATGVLLGTAPR